MVLEYLQTQRKACASLCASLYFSASPSGIGYRSFAFNASRLGRVPFDQNFRKSRFKIEWNRHFPEIRFENFGSPLEVVLFSGNLEIPEISCSIWHFYPVWICPSSFSREKLEDGSESFESTLHWMQNNVPPFEPVLDCLFSTFGSDFLENCGLVVPNFLRFSSLCLHTSRGPFPGIQFASCSHGVWLSQVR